MAHILFAFLWTCVLGTALELWARHIQHRTATQINNYLGERYQRLRRAEEEDIRENYPEVSPPNRPSFKPRADLFSISDEARLEFADSRHELVLLCGNGGQILAKYAKTLDPEVDDLNARMPVGTSLCDVLNSEQCADARAALRECLSAQADTVYRWYSIPRRPDGEMENQYELRFVADPVNREQCAVFAMNSMWKEDSAAFRPNFRSLSIWPDEVITNSHGFRDTETTTARPAGVFRIACIGGSTTAEGRRNDITYPKLLQAKLRAHFHSDAIEVLNCGVYGMSSFGELRKIEAVLALEPQLLLHYNFVNDARDVLYATYARDWRAPIRWLLATSSFVNVYFNGLLLPSSPLLAQSIDEYNIARLRSISDAARTHGAELAVCSFVYPRLAAVQGDELEYFNQRLKDNLGVNSLNARNYARLVDAYNQRARAFCTREGIFYVPVQEHFDADPERFVDICHMTVRGLDERAQITFELLRDYIGSKWRLP